MPKFIDKLREKPVHQRKMIVIGVSIFILVVGLASYPWWGTHIAISTPTFISSLQDDINATGGSLHNAISEASQRSQIFEKQQQAFETKLEKNDYLTNNEHEINSVAVNIRKVRIDTDLTMAWLRISNLTQNTLQVDPQSNMEIVSDGVTYLPKPLNNETLTQTLETDQGQIEILEKQTIAPQSSLEGYVAFQTVPSPESFTVRLLSVLNKDTLKKWNYDFVFDVANLKDQKAEK